jgi:ABC-type transporter Mla subunit MlaD
MSEKRPAQGSHAEAFAEVVEVLATQEESLIASAEEEARAEGLMVISRAVTAQTRKVALITGTRELKKAVEERDDLLMRAANLRELTNMRRNIDAVLAEQHPELGKAMAELTEMERQLRSRDRKVFGVLISAAPPNHPLVEKIKIKKEGIQAAKQFALAALDELIHFRGLEDEQALEAARLENSLWDTWKKSRKPK